MATPARPRRTIVIDSYEEANRHQDQDNAQILRDIEFYRAQLQRLGVRIDDVAVFNDSQAGDLYRVGFDNDTLTVRINDDATLTARSAALAGALGLATWPEQWQDDDIRSGWSWWHVPALPGQLA